MSQLSFAETFLLLTGNAPFPWQAAFYERCIAGDFPTGANIPTGLGKTSIVAIWLIALARYPVRVPRRLVYVVNRRTVVDQTTTEVERLRAALKNPELAEIRDALASLCALPLAESDAPPLAISTLRGQFADNGEWCADPSRPAVIVGTVDMIGSGLLFSRYTRSFKTRPLHAGFLGQDALLVHDEAHLEPAFQKLLESIVTAQKADGDPRTLRVIALTATSRVDGASGPPPLTLTAADLENETVKKRVNAEKRLSLTTLDDGEKLEAKLIALAKEKSGDRAVLIFTRSVETALKVAAELDKAERRGKIITLTGTMRGKERDRLATENPVFQRFLREQERAMNVEPAIGTVYLVATSAGEVGVNISADDLVCDLSTYESMAQRFGRLNRFNKTIGCTVTVVHETKFDTENIKIGKVEVARRRTLALLQTLGDSANSVALDKLNADERLAAFSPLPDMRTATDIQFDAWALTSIREPIAARSPIAPYLHGEAEWQPAETRLAWRDDRDFRHIEDPEAFLDDFPIKPAELLRDTTTRITATLVKLLDGRTNLPDAWLIAHNGSISRFALSAFDKDDAETSLADATLILPTSLGGLDANGLFSSKNDNAASDVSGIIRHEGTNRNELPHGAAKIVRFAEISPENAEEPRFLLWCEPTAETAIRRTSAARASRPETLVAHTADVAANVTAIIEKLFPASSAVVAVEPDMRRCIVVAASLHDLGKSRAQWQRNLGNLTYDAAKPETILAKSLSGMRPRQAAEHYRHEFGSLRDVTRNSGAISLLATLTDLECDIALHLVAAHHGRARPHFPEEEMFDYSAGSHGELLALATEVPRRFARLQKRFGRWGLAWLESILRAADYAASSGIVAQSILQNSVEAVALSQTRQSSSSPQPAVTATLEVNPTNPGHYFACCGLFEFAGRLSPEALAWFEQDPATRKWCFHIANTSSLAELLEIITSAEISAEEDEPKDEDDDEEDADEKESEKEASAPPLRIGNPFDLRLDWWTTASTKTSALKVWAGTMKVLRIARAMNYTVRQSVGKHRTDIRRILEDARIAYESPDDTFNKAVLKALKKKTEGLKKASELKNEKESGSEIEKIADKYEKAVLRAQKRREESVADISKGEKVEPFYFDAKRGPNAHSRDVGFAINDLKWETLASPAVELLTLVGLQRATPLPVPDMPRNFDYQLWTRPLPVSLLSAAVNGLLPDHAREVFRFESWFRTGQRKHKAFITARTISYR